jgi:hypothetical protein
MIHTKQAKLLESRKRIFCILIGTGTSVGSTLSTKTFTHKMSYGFLINRDSGTFVLRETEAA